MLMINDHRGQLINNQAGTGCSAINDCLHTELGTSSNSDFHSNGVPAESIHADYILRHVSNRNIGLDRRTIACVSQTLFTMSTGSGREQTYGMSNPTVNSL